MPRCRADCGGAEQRQYRRSPLRDFYKSGDRIHVRARSDRAARRSSTPRWSGGWSWSAKGRLLKCHRWCGSPVTVGRPPVGAGPRLVRELGPRRDLTPDAHRYFFDRYSRLARHYRGAGALDKARRFQASPTNMKPRRRPAVCGGDGDAPSPTLSSDECVSRRRLDGPTTRRSARQLVRNEWAATVSKAHTQWVEGFSARRV